MNLLTHAEQETIKVDLEPIGKRVRVPIGSSLLEAARLAGIDLVASCGGLGICSTCKVRVMQGTLSDLTQEEVENLAEDEIQEGMRLACQAIPTSDVKVDIPASSMVYGQRMQVEGIESEARFAPAVMILDIECPEPSLQDQRADLSRVNDALAEAGYPPIQAPLDKLTGLSRWLRQHNWRARLALRVEGNATQLVAVFDAQTQPLGLAMDLGSSKLALYLVDLGTGGTLAAFAIANPQISYGEDVINRIAYANQGETERLRLQRVLVDAINQAVRDQCQSLGLLPEQIVDVVAVGNTVVHHLFCGLPVEQLGRAPYIPAVQNSVRFQAAEIGLATADGVEVYLPPNLAGYVGADHVSALLASWDRLCEGCTLLVDIGTNTEISLVRGGQITSCSCASGPAFEGAHIRDGMRAAPGAIEQVTFQHGKPQVLTIGNQPAVGICGSGILHALAEMLNVGIMDQRGVIPGGQYVLVESAKSGSGREIVITRRDVNEIQLAKGAIRGGIDTLLAKVGVAEQEIGAFVIAGAFGTHLDVASAIRIGMFPELPSERFQQVGNAAGVGARQMLLSKEKRREAEALAERVTCLELTVVPEFVKAYTEAILFPE